MELKDKIKICMTCQNCKRDSRGVVCGLTDEKPTFDLQCPNYLADDDAVKQQKSQEEADAAEDKPKLPGAGWFRTIGIISLLNVVLAFISFVFMFGLGSTQILQALAELGVINKVLGYTIIVLIPIFFLWTWWISASKAYIYPYIVGLIIYMLDMVLCAVLLFDIGVGAHSASLVVTLIFQLIVIFSLFVALFSEESRRVRVKFSWGIHKVAYTIASALVVITIAASAYYGFNLPSINDDFEVYVEDSNIEMEEYIEDMNIWFPREVEEGCIIERIFIQDDDVVVEYTLEEGYYNECVLQNVSDEDLKIMVSQMRQNTSDYYMASQGYDIVYTYKNSLGEVIAEWHFSAEDILSNK